ncbi:hypothetical protein X975_22174, partial [Stegodyphus mimosarum]
FSIHFVWHPKILSSKKCTNESPRLFYGVVSQNPKIILWYASSNVSLHSVALKITESIYFLIGK